MTFSDGLPVQFWLTDCETFNEEVIPGINRACWCQPFNCDDEINIQFQHDAAQTVYLVAKNPDSNTLAYFECDEIADGVYAASFTPENEDICDEDIQLLISDDLTEGLEIISNPGFEIGGALSPWVSVAGAGLDWSQAGSIDPGLARAQIVFTGGAESSDPLQQDFTEQPAGLYRLLLRVFASSTSVVNVSVKVFNNGVEVQEILNTSYINVTDATDFDYDVLITDSFDRIEIVASKNGPAMISFSVSTGSLKPLTFDTFLAQSDCLKIRTSHPGTQLIEYSNNRNFAGLIYDDVSPEQSFFLRVPAVFFHKRFPQESRAIERTTSTIVTSSKLKKQRLLQVEHAPAYFHEKIIIALSHHNVEINGKEWKKEEAYEIEDGDLRYPLKKATVWLTEKNFIARNAL